MTTKAVTQTQDSMRDMVGLRDTISGLFDDFFSGRPMLAARAIHGEAGYDWSPAVDIRETDDAIDLYAALPGVDKQDVHLEVRDATLTLSGIRKGCEDEGWLRRELPTGSFYRAFCLPAEVDSGAVKASFKDGILEVHLPKAETAKPHRVQIT